MENYYELTSEELEFLKESNAIEGVYDASSLEQAIIAWQYLKDEDKITPAVILKTHKLLMLHQPLLPNEIGYFRKVPVWVGGRQGLYYANIAPAIHEWCKDVATSITVPGKDGENIKFDHIQYERIHPFVDGNGRTGRMFLNWERIQANLPVLVIHTGQEQKKYYQWFKATENDSLNGTVNKIKKS